jgi:hypothetical protein
MQRAFELPEGSVVTPNAQTEARIWFEAVEVGNYRWSMGKAKTAATGGGYLGEIMVHKISREVGVVETVLEAQAGWPPEISLKLKNGALRKGKLSDFKEASSEQKKKFNSSD